MRRALVIGASGGIGRALVAELSGRGSEVVGVSRSVDGLDVTDELSVAGVLGSLDGVFDLIVCATGALEVAGAAPEKSLAQLSAKAMADQFAVNCIGPALVLKHSVRLLPKEGRAVVAVLSARVGSIGDNRLGGWHSYRAAKAALNQIVRGASIEMARTHKGAICVSLHPGTVATEFTRKYLGRHPAVEPAAAAVRLVDVLEGVQPADSGGFYDYAMKEIPW
ncbi:MAG: SDR family NAD(P)-dependent oxidoreductase [Pseudomonadota bacterium]|nr:SDR family NAD(P)-dependent oxidoreductase [Pseudomonadota bacterium]MEE3070678.1 SDR family NAD(P)-dependent oxidoreductase [Pseudomonadota bacterium]